MSQLLSRELLAKFFGSSPRLLKAFEQISNDVDTATAKVADGVAATTALQEATVLTLSPNDTFTNERVLKFGKGIGFDNDGTYLTIVADGVAYTSDYPVTLVPPGPVTLFLPPEGTLATRDGTETLQNKTLAQPVLSSLGNYASDAAAATGGVPINGVYHNAGVLRIRLT